MKSKISNYYTILQKLDEGGFGIVYLAISKEGSVLNPPEKVAIKKLKKRIQTIQELKNLREVKSLCKMKHKNIVRLLQIRLINNEGFLIFEYAKYNLLDLYTKYK